MRIVRYQPHHYVFIDFWYRAHGQKPVPEAALPKTGLLAFKGEIPVACVFLYRTDSAICLFECLISNPHTARFEREEAFLRLWEAIILEAKSLGHTILMALPTHPNIKKFLSEKGMVEDLTPYSFMVGKI